MATEMRFLTTLLGAFIAVKFAQANGGDGMSAKFPVESTEEKGSSLVYDHYKGEMEEPPLLALKSESQVKETGELMTLNRILKEGNRKDKMEDLLEIRKKRNTKDEQNENGGRKKEKDVDRKKKLKERKKDGAERKVDREGNKGKNQGERINGRKRGDDANRFKPNGKKGVEKKTEENRSDKVNENSNRRKVIDRGDDNYKGKENVRNTAKGKKGSGLNDKTNKNTLKKSGKVEGKKKYELKARKQNKENKNNASKSKDKKENKPRKNKKNKENKNNAPKGKDEKENNPRERKQNSKNKDNGQKAEDKNEQVLWEAKPDKENKDNGQEDEGHKSSGLPGSSRQIAGAGSLMFSSDDCDITFNLNYGDKAILFSYNDRFKVKCNQIFQSPVGTTISFDCLQFNLNRKGCKKERMFVYPGIGGRKKSKFCKRNSPTITTPSNNLEIRYRRQRVKGNECSGGYLCTATVIGEKTTTIAPTPTKVIPTTPKHTSVKSTAKIPQPTTPKPATPKPTTPKPATPKPTTPKPATPKPTTPKPATPKPTTPKPATPKPTTPKPTTPKATTPKPTTLKPTTPKPTTPKATTPKPTTLKPTTPKPTTPKATTPKPTTPKATTPKATTPKPTTLKPTTPKPTTPKPTTPKPTTPKPTTAAASTSSVKRLFCNDGCGKATVTVPRIVGGEEASPNEYNWQVLLRIQSSEFSTTANCGGSIFKKGWILTAAHCFINPFSFTKFANLKIEAVLGDHDMSNDGEGTEIKDSTDKLIIHPNYKKNQASEDNDIALISLKQEVSFDSKVAPICMPIPGDYVPETTVIVTGWGVTAFGGSQPNELQEVALILKSQTKCKDLNSKTPDVYDITDNMVCTLEDKKDACLGDSGGPLVYQSADGRWIQLGIVSFGYQCARPNAPGFYTKLVNYLDWIKQETGGDQC